MTVQTATMTAARSYYTTQCAWSGMTSAAFRAAVLGAKVHDHADMTAQDWIDAVDSVCQELYDALHYGTGPDQQQRRMCSEFAAYENLTH